MPYFEENFTIGVMKNHDGTEIRYAESVHSGKKGALVIVDGRTEFMAKYAEVFYDLRNTGFSFYIYDHRGQGNSSRILADPEKGHVGKFEEYVEDLHRFLNTIVKVKVHKSIFLLSHSMGGTISILYARKYPTTVTGMILCSPMFDVNTAPFPKSLAKITANILNALGMGTRYVFGGKPYDRNHQFENNDLTDSYVRFELNKRLVEENPGVALGGPTIGWLVEAFHAIDRIKSDTIALPVPILLIIGEEDTVVGQKTQKEFCNTQPECSFVIIPKGKHELLMEKDQVRDTVLENIRTFLNHHTPSDLG
jgi:lysophospholipase